MCQSNKPLIGYLCSYTPLELLYAAGFEPFRIAGHFDPINKADTYINANICQYIRSIVDKIIAKEYDFLDGVVFVNSCDAMRRLFDVWKYYHPMKFLVLIDLPIGHSEHDYEYYKNELDNLKQAFEKYRKITITTEDVKKKISFFNDLRKDYQQLERLRKNIPPLITSTELWELNSEFFTCKTEILKFHEQIKQKIKEKQSVKKDPTQRPRIIIAGSPIHNIKIISFIEECGLDIIYEDVCSGSRFFDIMIEDNPNPLLALSKAYINKVPCARMMNFEERFSNLVKYVREYRADGIIHYSLKFCDNYLYDVPELKRHLTQLDIKSLFIEGDGTLGSIHQMKTRIEAFIEILNNK